MTSGCSFTISGGSEDEGVVADTTNTTGAATPTETTSEATDTSSETETADQPSNESTEPLPAGASLEQVLALVQDLHGPTSDISAQMNRLVRYPELPTPAGAHIAGIYARGVPAFQNEGRFEMWSEADFYADGTVDDLVVFYETQLPPLGWSSTKKANDTRFDGSPITVLEFEMPSSTGSRTETLEVTIVEDADLPELLVETRFIGGETDDRSFIDGMSGWFDPSLVPDNGSITSIVLATTAGEGRTDVTIDNQFRYESGETGPELLSDVEERGAASGFEIAETSRTDAVELVVPATERFYLSVYEATDYSTVTVEADSKFVNEELETADVVAVDKPTDPVPDFATVDQIETVVNEIHGPTADISAQMNRLTPFPPVPTPIGSSVLDLTASIDQVIGSDEVLSHFGAVTFEVQGTKDDTLLFFDAQIAALGWTESSRSDETEDDGLTSRTTVEYDIPDANAGSRPPFKLVVIDDVDKADVIVEWTYYEFISKNQALTERWLGWQGETPLPDGGELTSVTVSSDGIFGQAMFFSVEYDYEAVEEADLRSQVEGLVAGSDYGEDEPGVVESRLYLTHPVFTDAYIGFFGLGSGATRVDLSTQRPLG